MNDEQKHSTTGETSDLVEKNWLFKKELHEYYIKIYSENSNWCSSLRNRSWTVREVDISKEKAQKTVHT